MGLDTVELVMDVEEAFDISIPDADAEKIQTVGDLYRYILSKFQGPERETPRCLSAATFYRLRRGLMRCFRVPRREVRPRSAMETVIPVMDRRSEWKRLGESLGWKLPELVRPGWVWLVFLGVLSVWLMIVVFAWARLIAFAPETVFFVGVCFLIGAVLLGVTVYRLTKPFAVHFSSATVREMVPMILSFNFMTICRDDRVGWTRPEVWEALTTIVAEQVGVFPDQLTESTSFVNDLGMD